MSFMQALVKYRLPWDCIHPPFGYSVPPTYHLSLGGYFLREVDQNMQSDE